MAYSEGGFVLVYVSRTTTKKKTTMAVPYLSSSCRDVLHNKLLVSFDLVHFVLGIWLAHYVTDKERNGFCRSGLAHFVEQDCLIGLMLN